MSETTNFGFQLLDRRLPNWHHLYNTNIDILADRAAYLLALQDVDVLALQDKSILQYNSTSGKWEVLYRRRT